VAKRLVRLKMGKIALGSCISYALNNVSSRLLILKTILERRKGECVFLKIPGG
jgi:hypothetical protein